MPASTGIDAASSANGREWRRDMEPGRLIGAPVACNRGLGTGAASRPLADGAAMRYLGPSHSTSGRWPR
jgi:hypothetical protein